MCGLTGAFSQRRDPAALLTLVRQMNDSIAHRGPDGVGYFEAPGVVLGHRRLSIIDLAGGDQPIFNEDHSIAIVFNGEIYNYKELQADLKAKGHVFRTHSDTETIIHLYEEKGDACLEDLNGMFAFALYDTNRDRLLLARDRMGEKPIYYQEKDGELLFASELKALLASGAVQRDVDLDALDNYLAYGYVPAPQTIYRGVRKLPPAHYLVRERGKISIKPYWQCQMARDERSLSLGERQEELHALLRDSVRLRLRSDVPVGAFLSGGVDSSLIVALAAEQNPGIATYAIGFQEQDYSELQYAREVANTFGTDHHEFVVEGVEPDLFELLVGHFDEPFADPSSLPTYYVNREAARDLKVIISGDGGDELFCGYRRYQQNENVLHHLPGALRRPLFNFAADQLADYRQGKGWLRRMAASGAVHWQQVVGIHDPFDRHALWRPEFRSHVDWQAGLLAPYFNPTHGAMTDQRMLADQNTYLSDDILVKVDRNSMYHSLEVRVPFLDHRVVEYANSSPLAFKAADGVLKKPLKDLLSTHMSDEFVNRRKQGFALPIEHFLRGDLDGYARDMLASADTRSADYFNPADLKALLDGHARGQRDLSRRIWSLLWFEQWLRLN